MQKLFIIPALALLIAAPAAAEEVHLTADERVEWHQNEQKMVAVGNAVATKQDMNIRADRMTAFYETSKKRRRKSPFQHPRRSCRRRRCYDLAQR